MATADGSKIVVGEKSESSDNQYVTLAACDTRSQQNHGHAMGRVSRFTDRGIPVTMHRF